METTSTICPSRSSCCRPWLAHLPCCTQVRHQLLFQHAACLDKQAAIDRFVRQLHAFVGRELPLQPAGDLLRRPLERQLLRDAPS
jgi:hypothetical protein